MLEYGRYGLPGLEGTQLNCVEAFMIIHGTPKADFVPMSPGTNLCRLEHKQRQNYCFMLKGSMAPFSAKASDCRQGCPFELLLI